MAYAITTMGLTPGTTYYFCAVTSNGSGNGFGAVLSFTTPAPPSVVTTGATSITSNSAVLNGSANPTAAAAIGWFRLYTTDPGTCSDGAGTRVPSSTSQNLGNGTTPVGYAFNTNTVLSLTPGTTYYYCALASNSLGTSAAAVVSFTTQPVAPSVSTSPATALTATTATLNGLVNPGGGPTTGWFRYSATNPGSCSDTFGTRIPTAPGGSDLGSSNTSQSFSQPITGLTMGTTYYTCAIAQNSVGVTLGNLTTFVTPTAPSVTTNAAQAIADTSVTLAATVNPNGAATTGWFRYATTSPGTCNDTFGTRVPATGAQDLGSSYSASAFTLSAINLAPTTTYFYCAIAQNSLGVTFGLVVQFTTKDRPTVTTLAASSLTASSAVLNGSGNPNGASATGWFRFSITDPGSCSDSFGTRVPSSGGTSLGSGTTVATYLNNTNTVTSLQPGTTYYYCALASNTFGTSGGTVVSFTTLPALPSVSTVSATSLTATTATLNGSASPGGGATTGWFRYSTTNPGACNDTFGTRAPASGGSNLGSGQTSVPFTQGITGLTQGTVYYYCALASNMAGVSVGGLGSFTTPSAPTVTTNAVNSIGNITAQLNATANPNGDPANGWFRLGTTNPGTCDDTFGNRVPTVGNVTLGSSGSVPYAQPASGLSANTTYYVCAVAQNSLGISFGAVVSFTTFDKPASTTSPATSITSSTAQLNGTGNPNGSGATGWFRLFTADPGACNDTTGTRVAISSSANLGTGRTAVGYQFNTNTAISLSPGTTYWYCAVANNTYGTSLGALVTFTTPAVLPSVTTTSATAVTSTTAMINGSGIPGGASTSAWFRYSPTNPGGCSDTFGTRVPAMTGGTALGAGNASVPFSQALTGLTQGTTYYFCAIASNSLGTVFGGIATFTTPSAPSVTTNAASGVGDTTATLVGTANPNGDAATGWFRYSATNPGTCDDTFGTRVPASGGTALGSSMSASSYSQAVNGLTANTTYYYCAIAQNGLGISVGAVVSFTTRAPAAVTTLAATSLTTSTAQLNGSGNPNGASTLGWFRLFTTDPGTCTDTGGFRVHPSTSFNLGTGTTPVAFTYNTNTATSLTPGTTYYYCAIAQNSFGTAFGAIVPFTTPAAPPSVSTGSASAVTDLTATLNGTANPGGGPTTGWFRYSATSPGSCSDTFGTRVPAGTGGSNLGAGIASVAFSQMITGLTQGTTYYFCAIASNSAGTTFGSLNSFVTPTAPTVTTSPASGINDTTVTLNGSANPNRDTTTGWFRYSTTNPVTCDDMFGTRVPAGGGTDLGAGSSAVGFSQPLTGLTPTTTYYYCAIASNSLGIAFGSVVSFTTKNRPTVTTSPATVLTSSSAQLNGTGNPNGATASGWFRLYTTDPGSCSDLVGQRVHPSSSFNLGTGTAAVAFTYNTNTAIGLSPGTTYWYCAVANNTHGTSLGAVVTFTTPPAPPTVSTGSANPITSTSATLNASANPGGGPTTGWFRYSTTNPGSCNDTFGTRAPAVMGGSSLGSSNTSQPFSQPITGLAQGTTYYFCAIASNSAGTAFGSVGSFTTLTSPTVTTNAATSVSNLSAQLNGSANPNGDAANGWFRLGTSNPVTCDDSFGTRVPTVGSVTLGGGTGAVAYSQPASGLAPNTTY